MADRSNQDSNETNCDRRFIVSNREKVVVLSERSTRLEYFTTNIRKLKNWCGPSKSINTMRGRFLIQKNTHQQQDEIKLLPTNKITVRRTFSREKNVIIFNISEPF
jgi:hypothetical protein